MTIISNRSSLLCLTCRSVCPFDDESASSTARCLCTLSYPIQFARAFAINHSASEFKTVIETMAMTAHISFVFHCPFTFLVFIPFQRPQSTQQPGRSSANTFISSEPFRRSWLRCLSCITPLNLWPTPLQVCMVA